MLKLSCYATSEIRFSIESQEVVLTLKNLTLAERLELMSSTQKAKEGRESEGELLQSLSVLQEFQAAMIRAVLDQKGFCCDEGKHLDWNELRHTDKLAIVELVPQRQMVEWAQAQMMRGLLSGDEKNG